MRRIALAGSLLLACDRHEAPPPQREARVGGVEFDAAEQAALPPSQEGAARPIPAAPSGSADAVLAIFAGDAHADRLPLVDVDPGHEFEPALRDEVAPRIVRTGGGGPVVSMGMPTVSGSLDRNIVRRIARAHINEVRHCYSQTLVVADDLRGDLEVTFAISPDGATDKIAITSTTVPGALGKRVGECTTKAIKRWKFPDPTDGKPVAVTFPFTLAPS